MKRYFSLDVQSSPTDTWSNTQSPAGNTVAGGSRSLEKWELVAGSASLRTVSLDVSLALLLAIALLPVLAAILYLMAASLPCHDGRAISLDLYAKINLFSIEGLWSSSLSQQLEKQQPNWIVSFQKRLGPPIRINFHPKNMCVGMLSNHLNYTNWEDISYKLIFKRSFPYYILLYFGTKGNNALFLGKNMYNKLISKSGKYSKKCNCWILWKFYV